MKLLLTLIIAMSFLFSCSKDVNNPLKPVVYSSDTVKICEQVWMIKNLDVDHYRNGDSIPEVRDNATWANITSGAWCYYNNDPAMGAIFGKLYNWYAVNDPRGLAPVGWHVSSSGEWETLALCLGYTGSQAGDEIAGGKLKEAGTAHWEDTDNHVTNESGFTALPGGSRIESGQFNYLKKQAAWWHSNHAWNGTDTITYSSSILSYYNALMYDNITKRCFGMSVRCIKD